MICPLGCDQHERYVMRMDDMLTFEDERTQMDRFAEHNTTDSGDDESYECRSCHCAMCVPDGLEPLELDVRYCPSCAVEEIERLRSITDTEMLLAAIRESAPSACELEDCHDIGCAVRVLLMFAWRTVNGSKENKA